MRRAYYFLHKTHLLRRRKYNLLCRTSLVVSSCIVLLSVSRVYSLRWSTGRRVCASGEGWGVRLFVQGGWWLVVRSPSPLSSLPDPFSLDCLSRACQRTPRSFPYSWNLLQRCFGSTAIQWFAVVSSVTSTSLSTLFPALLNKEPASLYQRTLSGLPETKTPTAVIFVCVDSFIQALTAKHRMLNPSPAHAMRHTVLVTASAARYLAGSSSRSGYLTLVV